MSYTLTDPKQIIYSGHSKGGYIALMAAGLPKNELVISPAAIVVFEPAGFNAEYYKRIDPNVPVTLTWGEADTVVSQSLMQQIYDGLPSSKKQMITVKSYDDRQADHYFPMSDTVFGFGHAGISAYHYHAVWKWLLGAAWDLETNKQTNPYLYGDEALASGVAKIRHLAVRNECDFVKVYSYLMFLHNQTRLENHLINVF